MQIPAAGVGDQQDHTAVLSLCPDLAFRVREEFPGLGICSGQKMTIFEAVTGQPMYSAAL